MTAAAQLLNVESSSFGSCLPLSCRRSCGAGAAAARPTGAALAAMGAGDRCSPEAFIQPCMQEVARPARETLSCVQGEQQRGKHTRVHGLSRAERRMFVRVRSCPAGSWLCRLR